MGKRERFVQMMENTPPIDYLSALSSSRITPSMKESIRKMQDDGLGDGVINIITDYVMRKNSNRYSCAYALRIAETLLQNGTITVEQALSFFASITKNKKKEEARKQRDEEKVTPEDVAELLADFTFTESIPLGLTDEEREELTNFDKKISSGSVNGEQIKAYLKDFDMRSRETKKRRLEAMKKEFVAEFVKGAV